jgi:hypothetical protein
MRIARRLIRCLCGALQQRLESTDIPARAPVCFTFPTDAPFSDEGSVFSCLEEDR